MLNRPSRIWPPLRGKVALMACFCGLTLPGCAGGLSGTWADFKTRREIETAAADDSFPDAAEAGLLSASAGPTAAKAPAVKKDTDKSSSALDEAIAE